MHGSRAEVPPDPAGATSYDELSERLRKLRSWAGVPYRETHRRVLRLRTERGVPELPAYNTVYRCLQPGRSRIDAELVVDIATALLGDTAAAEQWRQACRAIETRASDAAIVTVTDTLPAELATFTGRDTELGWLLDDLTARSDADAAQLTVIEGMAGVGKTTMAMHLAHRLIRAGRFAEVCLAVNLRGYDADLPPAEPSAVLGGFLRVLGISGSQIACLDLADRARMFRAQLAGQHALILLDNAASLDQVHPLLPQHPSCLALVTSRRQLDGLNATRLPLPMFSAQESLHLLRREIGADRIATDPGSAAAITEVTGHLPLALSLIAGRINATPDWTLADHLDRLTHRREHLRLEDSVQLAVGQSYDDLGARQRRLLRLAALHPGRDFDVYAMAAIASTELGPTADLLAELTAANLLQQRDAHRFELHDVVRVFAADRARDEDPARTRRAALGRLLHHYRYLALTAMNVYAPQDAPRQPVVTDPGTPRPNLPDRPAATQWLDSERRNLLATASHAPVHGWPHHTGQLSLILASYLDLTGRFDDAKTLHTLASRTATGHLSGWALRNLAATTFVLGRRDEAMDQFTHAAASFRECGDHVNESATLLMLAGANGSTTTGRFPEAHRLSQRAVRTARATDDRISLARALRNLGVTHYLLGAYREAADACLEALAIVRETGDRVVEAAALIHLGSATARLGDSRDALKHLQLGLWHARGVGHRRAEADALNQLGVTYAGLRRYEFAMDHHDQALAIIRDDGMRQAEPQIRNDIGSTLCSAGHHDRATLQHREVLGMAHDQGDHYELARAHDGLGTSTAATGDLRAARHHWQQALALYAELGTPEAADIAVRLRKHPPTDT